MSNQHLKPNMTGLAGAIIAFASLVLPWWTMLMFPSPPLLYTGTDVSVYPFTTQTTPIIPWVPYVFGNSGIWIGRWFALVLVLIGGVMGEVGSLLRKSFILVTGGLLALLSVIIFAVDLQLELSREWPISGGSAVSLFSWGDVGFNYVTYLSFGFWLALIAGIVMLVASRTRLETGAPEPVPPPA